MLAAKENLNYIELNAIPEKYIWLKQVQKRVGGTASNLTHQLHHITTIPKHIPTVSLLNLLGFLIYGNLTIYYYPTKL